MKIRFNAIKAIHSKWTLQTFPFAREILSNDNRNSCLQHPTEFIIPKMVYMKSVYENRAQQKRARKLFKTSKYIKKKSFLFDFY